MTMLEREMIEPGVVRAQWWHRRDDGRIQCDLCPRECKLNPGQRGFCFVRQERDGGIALTSYGRAAELAVDPIEKKPLNHFLPGTTTLSLGTVGCNLGCRHCQNWELSRARRLDATSLHASPAEVAGAASDYGCRSVAFTYNDPVVFAEYAIDCAKAAHERGLRTVAVSAGYMNAEPRREFYAHIDAANIDLKAFTDEFYHGICFAELSPVLETLVWLKRETSVWLEVTNLLIPGRNDSPEEVARLCDWYVEHLGPEVPLHFTAFHPDYRMMDVLPTPVESLIRARRQAKASGILHVYTGNIRDIAGQSTRCGDCGTLLIERDGYEVRSWHLSRHGACPFCGAQLAGHFEAGSGMRGVRR